MTKGELYTLEKRVDEINEVLDLCSDNDGDVIDNLNIELDEILYKLEKATEMEKQDKNLYALSTAIETHAINAIDRHVENLILTYGEKLVREVLEMKCINMKQAEKPSKKKIAK